MSTILGPGSALIPDIDVNFSKTLMRNARFGEEVRRTDIQESQFDERMLGQEMDRKIRAAEKVLEKEYKMLPFHDEDGFVNIINNIN